jgi:Terminase DNA packaging enzyme
MIANGQNISAALGVAYTINPPAPDKEEIVVSGDNKAENDYEYARRNLYDIISSGSEALDDMINFAKQAQHPRAYEVVGTLINNLVDANQKLLHLSKQVKEIKNNGGDKQPSGDTINNNLFVGSTAELQKLLKGDND